MSNFDKTSLIKFNNLVKTSSFKHPKKTSTIKCNSDKTSSFKHNFKRTASIQKGFLKSSLLNVWIERNYKSNCSYYIKCIHEKEKLEEEEKDDNLTNNNIDNKKRKINKEKGIKSCDKKSS